MSAIVGRSDASQAGPVQKARSLRVGVPTALSIGALIVSGASLVAWFQADDERRQLEERLVCLELPGANDCGSDGR